MEAYQHLFHMAKTLLSGGEDHQLPSFFLRRMVRLTGAAHGLIVVNEDGQFNEKMHIGFSGKDNDDQRRLCKSLVRRALGKRELVTSENLGKDQRFSDALSVQMKKGVAAMAVPLCNGNEIYAAVYLEKATGQEPFDDQAQILVREFAEMAGMALQLAVERDYLTRLKNHRNHPLVDFDFGDIVCRHPKMLAVLELVAQVADADATVLVRGETGTGKELIARAIYANSARRDKPFLTLHCGALPETLFETELFGHVKGAFTGADRDRLGRVVQAHGGTLFLDEVGEIPLPVQAKLLRFLQFGEYQRVGSDHVSTVDTRIVAATHQNLAKLVEEGRFRQDLYYRLNVIELTIPPLRERISDIPFLLEAFLRTYWRGPGEPLMSPEARCIFMTYDYPGNVRELAHAVERACLLARNGRIERNHLPETMHEVVVPDKVIETQEFGPGPVDYTNEELKELRQQVSKAATNRLERRFCEGLMARHHNNVVAAARAANMQTTYLYKLLARTGVPYK